MSYRWKAAVAAAVMGVAVPAYAQDSATADSSVTIIVPLEIAKTADLNFGTVARPITGSGTVSINPTTGARVVSGSAAAVAGGTTGRAAFNVTGDGARAYTATIPASFVLTNGTPADDITVALASSLGSTGSVVTALTAGAQTIGVGGDFTITAATPAAQYDGTFTVSVAYN